MLGLSAFRRKARQFNYKPLYYDPVEEAHEERKKELLGANYKEAYKDSMDIEATESKPQIRFRRGIMAERRAKSSKSFTLRAIIFIILLLVCGFFLAKGVLF